MLGLGSLISVPYSWGVRPLYNNHLITELSALTPSPQTLCSMNCGSPLSGKGLAKQANQLTPSRMHFNVNSVYRLRVMLWWCCYWHVQHVAHGKGAARICSSTQSMCQRCGAPEVLLGAWFSIMRWCSAPIYGRTPHNQKVLQGAIQLTLVGPGLFEHMLMSMSRSNHRCPHTRPTMLFSLYTMSTCEVSTSLLLPSVTPGCQLHQLASFSTSRANTW